MTNISFNPVLMHLSDLNASLVLVKLNGKDLYLDPGTPFAPFGILPWYKTGIQGLRLDKDGGTWTKTTMYAASASGIHRTAAVQLDDSGTLEGKVTVTFKGLSALARRTDQRPDEGQRRNIEKFLQDELRECNSRSRGGGGTDKQPRLEQFLRHARC